MQYPCLRVHDRWKRKQWFMLLLSHLSVLCNGEDCPRNVEVIILRNWDSSRVSKQENVQVAAGKTVAMEFYKEFYNVATFFYRWCDPDDAEGKNCKEPEYKNKKNYLTTHNANGYCEGVKNKDYPKWLKHGGKVGDEDALAELDLGEADAMNHALSRQMGLHQRNPNTAMGLG